MKSLAPPIIKSVIFIVITALATALLALTITNGSDGGGKTIKAIFTDVTLLNTGDDVRMAGVRIGQVQSVKLINGGRSREAEVTMSLPDDRRVARTVTASIRYRNLIGQRYVQLDQGNGSLSSPMPDGATIPTSRTQNALDLTALFNGFQPLFKALDPKDINQLSGQLIAVFQGEGPTVDSLLAQAGQLTSTIADKDKVIGQVITNLNSVLNVVNSRKGEFTTLIASLQQLVSGLSADREGIGQAITGISGLTSDVADLLQQGRSPLKSSITSLGALSGNLADSADTLNSFFNRLPTKLTTIGRTASYGSWLNVYLCSIGGRIPVPTTNGDQDGTPVYGNVPTTQYPAPAGISPYPTVPVGNPNPAGLVGVDNLKTARCNA